MRDVSTPLDMTRVIARCTTRLSEIIAARARKIGPSILLQPLRDQENNHVHHLKKLIVEPGSKIRLKHFDPGYHGKHESRKSALPEIEENRQKMQELQYLMYAENKHSLLIVLQGLDAGGKDGVVRHVLTGMNPSGC